MKVPETNKERFYRRCLEVSDQSLGVKLTLVPNAAPDNDWLYATYERDIQGIDYNETVTCINDMGLWADWLDDQLKSEFGEGGSGSPTDVTKTQKLPSRPSIFLWYHRAGNRMPLSAVSFR